MKLNQMIKTVFSVAVAGTMILSLVACGSTQAKPSGDIETANTPQSTPTNKNPIVMV